MSWTELAGLRKERKEESGRFAILFILFPSYKRASTIYCTIYTVYTGFSNVNVWCMVYGCGVYERREEEE